MDLHGHPWISMDIHVHLPPMDIHGYRWIVTDIHGIHGDPWTAMDLHGYAWLALPVPGDLGIFVGPPPPGDHALALHSHSLHDFFKLFFGVNKKERPWPPKREPRRPTNLQKK